MEDMGAIWSEIRSNNSRLEMLKNLKTVPQNFDQIYSYLNDLLFRKNNVEFDKTYCGRAWILEMFINSQS